MVLVMVVTMYSKQIQQKSFKMYVGCTNNYFNIHRYENVMKINNYL